VGGVYGKELENLLNNLDVVPDLKEKSRVELGYILLNAQNYKWLTSPHL
jgi:hypothetical protein